MEFGCGLRCASNGKFHQFFNETNAQLNGIILEAWWMKTATKLRWHRFIARIEELTDDKCIFILFNAIWYEIFHRISFRLTQQDSFGMYCIILNSVKRHWTQSHSLARIFGTFIAENFAEPGFFTNVPFVLILKSPNIPFYYLFLFKKSFFFTNFPGFLFSEHFFIFFFALWFSNPEILTS